MYRVDLSSGNDTKRHSFYSHGKEYQELNLDRLQHWIQSGRIDGSKTITMKDLLDSRCIHKIEDGVKLLGVVSLCKGEGVAQHDRVA